MNTRPKSFTNKNSKFSRSWWRTTWVERALIKSIQRGFLPDYKYRPSEKLLISIQHKSENSLSTTTANTQTYGNEIIPPVGIKRTVRISTFLVWLNLIVYLAVASGFIVTIFLWEQYYSIGLLVFALYTFGTSYVAVSYNTKKVITAARSINKNEISLQELLEHKSMRWAKFMAMYYLKRAITKGYLHEYKYLIRKRLLVRI